MGDSELDDFRHRYEQHVGHVQAGDVKAAVADMVPENLATVFNGVRVPRTAVERAEIVAVYPEGDTLVGEAVYHLTDDTIGLRSVWERHGDRWLAARLENFAVDAAATDQTTDGGAS